MDIVEKLKLEESELEKQFFGTGEGEPEVTATSPDETKVEEEEGTGTADESTQVTESTETVESPVDSPKKPRTSWKKRYTSYKSTTDATIYNLRQDLAATKAELADALDLSDTLKVENQDLKSQINVNSDPYKDILSKEQKEILGEEAVEAMQKIAEANKTTDPRVEKLEKELEQQRKEKVERLRKEKENLATQSHISLSEGLAKIVDDFEEIDKDPEFHMFLQGMDEVSRQPRSNLFAAAVSAKDVQATARFYNDFIATKPKTKEEILSSKVTPTGTGSTPVTTKGKPVTHSISEYETYMDAVTRGDIKDRTEIRKQDAYWDKAFMEGRVV